MQTKGRRQSNRIEDRRDGTGANEVKSGYAAFSSPTDNVNYASTKGSASDSQGAKDAGSDSMGSAAARDRQKTKMQGRSRWPEMQWKETIAPKGGRY